jgi:hypothetical protein
MEMTEKIDIAALRAHAAKGWGTDALIPKSVIEMLCAELQSARATPADHNNYPGLVQGERVYAKDRATEQATPADHSDDRLDMSLEARLADAEADVLRLHKDKCDLLMKYEWCIKPADHIGDAAEKVDADSVPVAIYQARSKTTFEAPWKDCSKELAQLAEEGGLYETRVLYTSSQSPQKVSDSVRDAVIEECALSYEKFFMRHETTTFGYVIDGIRALKSAPPQKPVSEEDNQ